MCGQGETLHPAKGATLRPANADLVPCSVREPSFRANANLFPCPVKGGQVSPCESRPVSMFGQGAGRYPARANPFPCKVRGATLHPAKKQSCFWGVPAAFRLAPFSSQKSAVSRRPGAAWSARRPPGAVGGARGPVGAPRGCLGPSGASESRLGRPEAVWGARGPSEGARGPSGPSWRRFEVLGARKCGPKRPREFRDPRGPKRPQEAPRGPKRPRSSEAPVGNIVIDV